MNSSHDDFIFLRFSLIRQYFWQFPFYLGSFLIYLRVVYLCSFNALPSLFHNLCHSLHGASQVALVVKNTPGQRSTLKRYGFSPWFRKIPRSRKWQPTPLYLPRESHRQEEPGRLQSIEKQRVRYNWSDLARLHVTVFAFPVSPTSLSRITVKTCSQYFFKYNVGFFLMLQNGFKYFFPDYKIKAFSDLIRTYHCTLF